MRGKQKPWLNRGFADWSAQAPTPPTVPVAQEQKQEETAAPGAAPGAMRKCISPEVHRQFSFHYPPGGPLVCDVCNWDRANWDGGEGQYANYSSDQMTQKILDREVKAWRARQQSHNHGAA